MKKEHKIYFILWGVPLLILIVSLFILLIWYKKSIKPLPEIMISSNYLQLINELNNLNISRKLKLISQSEIAIDPFISISKTSKSNISSKIFQPIHLSMIYIEGGKKVCIINNISLKENDYVGGNIKIVKIGDYYVDLQMGKKTKRIFLGQTLTF